MKLYTSREQTALSFTFHKTTLLCNKNCAVLKQIYPQRISESNIKSQKFARLPFSIMDYKSFSGYYPVNVDTLPFGELRCSLRGDKVLSTRSCLINVVMKLEITTVYWCPGIRCKIIGTKWKLKVITTRRLTK
jgi:hypothetical protein